MFLELFWFLSAITVNSFLIYWQKVKNASKLSIFLGSVGVLGAISGYCYYMFILDVEEVREFDQNTDWKDATSVHNFTVTDIKGETVPLKNYEGHVLLIVNVASKCGLTNENYEELVELDQTYREAKGLRILAFPCNQFGEQEPGTNEGILKFAREKSAKFDFFDKIEVNGENAHVLWKYLAYKTDEKPIEWNFAKFIINKNGKLISRFHPDVSPMEILESLEELW